MRRSQLLLIGCLLGGLAACEPGTPAPDVPVEFGKTPISAAGRPVTDVSSAAGPPGTSEGDGTAGMSAADARPAISGLTASILIDHMAATFFSCEEQSRGEVLSWTCRDADAGRNFVVHATGASQDAIAYVRAVSLSDFADPTIGRDFLAHVARMQYPGARPEEARTWVEANVESVAETVIGQTKFRMSGTDRVRLLELLPAGAVGGD